jgi:tetratricopeptide (TPR) repeat protein
MRWMFFINVLVVSLALATGCISKVPSPSPQTPPGASCESFVPPDGSALAIAFKSDEITTFSPEAKELFIKGLTYSTQYARYNESLAFFDAALAIDQDFTEAWVAKGVVLHNMKRYDEAIENYDKALAINPDDAGTWSVKAITLMAWGKPEEAAECNQKASKIDPRYGNIPRAAGTPDLAKSYDGYPPPVPAGGDVYLGESCLNVSAGVSSGQVVSWYKNGYPGNTPPDASRIVRDSQNFFVDPEEFLGYEGKWYVRNTDTIAFVVKDPILDTRKNPII